MCDAQRKGKERAAFGASRLTAGLGVRLCIYVTLN